MFSIYNFIYLIYKNIEFENYRIVFQKLNYYGKLLSITFINERNKTDK